ncbi:MAG: phenylacetate--CoA ligase family protein [Candidatus Atribacteria bacterium]|nr:phenylacetate--CoA ligase family protein [Candidatus Atribacteria bacterium]
MKLFNTSLKVQGYPIDIASLKLNIRQSLNKDQFIRETDELRHSIFEFHKTHNIHYRQFLGSRLIKDWNDIPVMTKQSVQVNVSERLSDGFTLKNVYLNSTSGSSGHPFYFAKDKFSHAMTWAVIMNRYNRHGIDPNHSLQARFFGIPLNSRGYINEKIKDKLSNRVRFPVFDLSEKVLDKYLHTFTTKPFEYLNGYSSSLVLFAKHVTNRGFVLKDICPTLKLCITTSEICFPEDRFVMQKSFGVKVVNEYGAAELDLIAFEDEDLDWIMTNENLYFEVVDDNNNPVENGNEGKLLVTSLYNKAMPFIRYEIGDIVRIKREKKGNNQILESLIGRTNDIAVLPSGKKSPGLTFYYISKSLLEQGGFLKEFIIKQTRPDHFIFEYVASQELHENQKRKIRKKVDLYLEPGLECEFKRVDKIDRTKAGKLKHFQKLF